MEQARSFSLASFMPRMPNVQVEIVGKCYDKKRNLLLQTVEIHIF